MFSMAGQNGVAPECDASKKNKLMLNYQFCTGRNPAAIYDHFEARGGRRSAARPSDRPKTD